MTDPERLPDPKADLLRQLDTARDALLWKLEGLGEYDLRRPLTPTGTNLLGIVKHVASVESGYLGDVMGRPSGEPLPWFDTDAEPNADMWATEHESAADIIALYTRVRAHSDRTIEALSLDDTGEVPWWPEARRTVTLLQVIVHVIAETHRHAGHADIVRELIDGAVGHRAENDNMPPGDGEWWVRFCDRVERAALLASAPNFGGALAPILGQVSADARPRFLAMLERTAADRYRGWADAWPEQRDVLLQCAVAEDEIADRIEAAFACEPEALIGLEALLPQARDIYYALFDGHSVQEQLRMQAAAELQGAVAWQHIAARLPDTDDRPALVEALATCSALEERSSVAVRAIVC